MATEGADGKSSSPPEHVVLDAHRAPVKAGAQRPTAQAEPAAQPLNIGKVIFRGLRGRYLLAISLGILLGGGAAAVAWRLGYPIYESQGLIRIANARPQVLSPTDQNEAIPMLMFDTFMQSQKLLISSRRVVDVAVQDPIWKAMNSSVPQPADKFFSTSMKVDVRSRSEIISVAVDDRDPATACAAVTSVLNAFNDYYTEEEKRTERQRSGILVDRREEVTRQIEKLHNLVATGSQEFGGSRPELFCDAATQKVARLEGALGDIRTAIAAHSSDESAGGSGRAAANRARLVAELSPQEIAMSDPGMRALLDEEFRTEQEVRRMLRDLGPAHPQVLAAKQSIEDLKERVANQASMYNQFRSATSQNLSDGRGGAVAIAGKTLAELKDNEKTLTKLLDQAKQEMTGWATKQMTLQQNTEQLNTLKAELAQIEGRIETLQTEGALGGRLTIVSSGDIPISPVRDTRPRFAGGAAAAGFCLPASLIILSSLVRRRYRYANDTESEAAPHSVPLLGVLPELRKNDADVERLALASHNVHQIRMSLGALGTQGGAKTYLVTSAAAGEGKTTLTISLGLSFAASKVRTLIIDGDMVGRKLTSAFRARELEGLHEAISSGTIRQRVRRTDSGLYLLTAGRAGATDACTIPRDAIQSLIAEARGYFDVVLIDSGPILGSLEASVLAPEVDGVIFAISRGQERHVADAAMRRLRSLGATVVGCVFNRAKSGDMYNSTYGSSSRMSLPDPNQPTRGSSAFVGDGFGPVVQAVAAGMPESAN
jgi:capsular exopolysaccharide synthesis family protein